MLLNFQSSMPKGGLISERNWSSEATFLVRDKGGLISKSFSHWLKSQKK